MSCNIVINQQLSASDGSSPETKVKDPERQRRGNVHEKTKRKAFKV